MNRTFKITREDVYKSIDSERTYQDIRWNGDTTITDGIHPLSEWFMFIEDYVDEAKHILSREAEQTAYPKVAHIMRKVAGMAVCAMEQNGAPKREIK